MSATKTEAPVIEKIQVPIESHLHPVASWDLADHPMPSGKEEVWRFTPTRVLTPLLDGGASSATLHVESHVPDGVTARTIGAAEATELSDDAPVDRIAALAVANATEATLIEIPAEAALTEPVEINLRGEGQLVWGRVVIKVGANAAATIVVRHEGDARYATKIDVQIGDGAQVNFVSLQDWDADALHGGQISYRIGRDAKLRTVMATLGGRLVRLVERARFDGPGGEIEQYGLYFTDGGQHAEHRIFVDHNEPNTVSHCDYRGALQGRGAHSVWIGDVLIRKQAKGITTYESNRNLVLTEGCRADSVPNLEIETGEIEGAGHSASTGRFDDEQLFYLCSRGIPEDEARRLVVQGFFLDIIRKIGVATIEERLRVAVDAELEIMTTTNKEN